MMRPPHSWRRLMRDARWWCWVAPGLIAAPYLRRPAATLKTTSCYLWGNPQERPAVVHGAVAQLLTEFMEQHGRRVTAEDVANPGRTSFPIGGRHADAWQWPDCDPPMLRSGMHGYRIIIASNDCQGSAGRCSLTALPIGDLVWLLTHMPRSEHVIQPPEDICLNSDWERWLRGWSDVLSFY